MASLSFGQIRQTIVIAENSFFAKFTQHFVSSVWASRPSQKSNNWLSLFPHYHSRDQLRIVAKWVPEKKPNNTSQQSILGVFVFIENRHTKKIVVFHSLPFSISIYTHCCCCRWCCCCCWWCATFSLILALLKLANCIQSSNGIKTFWPFFYSFEWYLWPFYVSMRTFVCVWILSNLLMNFQL